MIATRAIRRILLVGALFAPLAITAQAAGGLSPAPSTAVPSVTLPPDLDRVLRDYEKYWRTGDAAGLAAMFTPDGFILQPGRPPVQGREAIEATYKPQASGDLRLRAYSFSFGDTVGFIVGGYRYGEAAEDSGKFTLTLKRTRGGVWMIHSDMENGNTAPRRMMAPATPPG